MSRLQEFAGTHDLAINLTLRELRGRYKRSVLGLDLVAAQPAGDRGDLLARLRVFLKIEPPTGRPERPAQLRAVPAVRAAPVEPLPERPQHGDGLARRQRQPHQEGVLPPRAPRRLGAPPRWWSRSSSRWACSAPSCSSPATWSALDPGDAPARRDRTVFVLGIALVLSVCNVYFRDVQHFVAICCRCSSTRRRSSTRSASCPSTRPCSASTIPLLRHLLAQPAGACSSSASATCSTTCASRRSGTSRTSRVGDRHVAGRATGCSASSTADSPRRCDGGARRSWSTASRSASASTTSATSR